jgi:hypothetical protein
VWWRHKEKIKETIMLQGTIETPYVGGVIVTPNDAADLTKVPTRALYVGVGGTLKVTTVDGSVMAMTVTAGLLPLNVTRVWAIGTASTFIAALY